MKRFTKTVKENQSREEKDLFNISQYRRPLDIIFKMVKCRGHIPGIFENVLEIQSESTQLYSIYSPFIPLADTLIVFV